MVFARAGRRDVITDTPDDRIGRKNDSRRNATMMASSAGWSALL